MSDAVTIAWIVDAVISCICAIGSVTCAILAWREVFACKRRDRL